MRVRSGIWSVKFGKGTTRYRKSEKQRQRRTMRGEREQPPDRTSLLIISSHVAEPPRRVYQTIRASPFSPHGLSLRVVSRSPPIPLSVHTFLFRLLFSLSRCFSWQKTHLRRERKSGSEARTNGKSFRDGDAWRNHFRR